MRRLHLLLVRDEARVCIQADSTINYYIGLTPCSITDYLCNPEQGTTLLCLSFISCEMRELN